METKSFPQPESRIHFLSTSNKGAIVPERLNSGDATAMAIGGEAVLIVSGAK